MSPFAILWPAFAMVALVFAVWFTLLWQRLRFIKRQPPTRADFASRTAMLGYFGPVARPAENLANLFEMPVLFFALVPLLLITAHVNGAQVTLAWAFVVLRAAHSLVHLGANKVRSRYLVYFASVAALMAMWIGFFVDMVVAANAYRDAVAGMMPGA